jgi:hypothetical protein
MAKERTEEMGEEIVRERLLGVVTCTCGSEISIWRSSYKGGVGIAIEVIESSSSFEGTEAPNSRPVARMVCPLMEADPDT